MMSSIAGACAQSAAAIARARSLFVASPRDDVYNAVCELVGAKDGTHGPQVDQLFLYFAGHGVCQNGNETWLLSGAADDPAQAINVVHTAQFANWGPVPHVVLFSDACRSAAPGEWGEQLVPSAALWMPPPRNDDGSRVDVFFACHHDFSAAEVSAPSTLAKYMGLFTTALLDAVTGETVDDVAADERPLFESEPNDTTYTYMYADQLADWLPAAVVKLAATGKFAKVPDQRPDYRSFPSRPHDQGKWIARLAAPVGNGAPPASAPPVPPSHRGVLGGAAGWNETLYLERPRGQQVPIDVDTDWSPPRVEPVPVITRPRNLPRFAASLVTTMLTLPGASLSSVLSHADVEVPGADALIRAAQSGTTPTEPGLGQAETAIVMRSGRIHDAYAADPSVITRRTDASVACMVSAPTSVLVTFTAGTGTVVPVLPGFHSIITFDEQRQAVDDISFEPSESSPVWEPFHPRRQRIREFRSVATACALRAVFQVRDRSVGALDRSLRTSGRAPNSGSALLGSRVGAGHRLASTAREVRRTREAIR
jgi:hypothetical protein